MCTIVISLFSLLRVCSILLQGALDSSYYCSCQQPILSGLLSVQVFLYQCVPSQETSPNSKQGDFLVTYRQWKFLFFQRFEAH